MRGWVGKVFIAASLDGYIARGDGDIAWLTDPPANYGHVAVPAESSDDFSYEHHMKSVDHLVIGRGTYEKILSFNAWPYPEHSVLLLSTTAAENDPRVTVVRSVDETVEELNRRNAAGVYVDGGQVIQEFLRRGLIDELTVTHAPVLIGSGLSLFGHLDKDVRLTHLGTTTIESGMVTSRYQVA